MERCDFHEFLSGVLTLLCLPLAAVYWYSGPELPGFSQAALSNALAASKVTQTYCGWIAVVACYGTHVLFLSLLDALDSEAATETASALAEHLRTEHYVVVILDLEGVTAEEREESARRVVAAKLGRDTAVLSVALVARRSATNFAGGPASTEGDEDAAAARGSLQRRMSSLIFDGDGLRENVKAYELSLFAVLSGSGVFFPLVFLEHSFSSLSSVRRGTYFQREIETLPGCVYP